MNSTRALSTLGAAAVAGIAAWSSWSHMVGVALRVGERPEVAYLLPLSVDGLLITASAAMVDDKRAGRTPRWSARVAFTVGVVASLAANIAHAHPSAGARIIAGWPALALLLTVELLSRAGRKNAEASQVGAPTAVVAAVAAPAARKRQPARQVRRPVAESRQLLRELLADDPATPTDSLARSLGVSERRVRQLLAAGATS